MSDCDKGVETIRDEVTEAFRRYLREGTDYEDAFRRDAARARKVLRDAAIYCGRQRKKSMRREDNNATPQVTKLTIAGAAFALGGLAVFVIGAALNNLWIMASSILLAAVAARLALLDLRRQQREQKEEKR